MFKNLTHAGLTIALIFPPWPLPAPTLVAKKSRDTLTFQSNYCQKSKCPDFLPQNPGSKVFAHTLRNLTVTTTILKSDETLIQDVFMQGPKEEVKFKFILEPNASFKTDEFIFSQMVENDNIVTKEWIVTKEQNVAEGSVYQWQFVSNKVLALEKMETGGVSIIKRVNEKQVKLAHIEPFVYWTKQGLKKNALVGLDRMHNGEYLMTLNIQEPKSAYPLYIDPSISYGQWLGDGTAAATTVAAVAVELGTGEIYVGGGTTGIMLQAVTIVATYNGGTVGYVAEVISANPPVVNWMMFIGGSSGATLNSLAVNGDEIYAGGYTAASDSWNTVGSTVGTLTDAINEGFVVEIADGSPPSLAWRMWVGGVGDDKVLALAVDGDEIYAGGSAASSDSWDTAGTTVGTLTNTGNPGEGFVVEIADGSPPILAWRMWLGGESTDQVTALAVNGDEIYAGGYTGSSGSWDTAGSTVGTLTNVTNEGFVVEIADGGPPTLAWRMWLGGENIDQVTALVVNGDEIYAGGYTNSSGSWDTAGSTVGTLTNTGNPGEGFVVEIADGGPPTLAWRMWLGGVGIDAVYALAVNGDAVYAGLYTTTSFSMETFTTVSGRLYVNGVNGAFLVELDDGSPPTYFWLQWLSGHGASQVNALAVNGDEIYAGGYTYGQTLGTVPDVGTPNNLQEGFVIEIADGVAPSLNWRVWLGGDGASKVNALAVNGDEIYAGGDTVSSDSWDTAGSTVGTLSNVNTSTIYEGFVVEIADGNPPTLAWRMWLGGSYSDLVLSLAVNGDEIYGGGYAIGGSVSWDTAGSTAGTFTGINREGFVVEIADGSPPTLAWLMWVGGSAHDVLYALAINGDEIYASGYSAATTSWDTAGSTAGTNSGFEGIVVEIADGSPPTLTWHMWVGGDGTDSAYALAVNGDEIYAGGSTDSSDSWDTAGSTVGTLTNTGTNAEGFVVEIADGGPPTLAWRMWLGGVGADLVYALAVNGDEIYAGGYTNSSDSWDTVISLLGTFTNGGTDEGFVAEITDGSPPTLNWVRWQGGVGADQVLALAVNGNEIYAGGYIPLTADMEATFQGTKYDGTNSGFIIEITDDDAVTVNAIFFGMDF